MAFGNIMQVGPDFMGFMDNTGAGAGSCLVCTGDPPQSGFPTARFEYWFMPGGFPSSNWSALQGEGAGPSYSSHQGSWYACPNSPFGAAKPSYSITIDANDRFYDVTCYVNGVALTGPTFHMFIKRETVGNAMGWIGENMPAGQNFLFPPGTTGTLGLGFRSRGSGTYPYTNVRTVVEPLTVV